MDGPSRPLAGPSQPRTIEESTRRYLSNYVKNFNGPAHEMARLKSMTKALIYRLRKVAPRFYEERLPLFINQACTTLLTYDSNKLEDATKFHMCHRSFMQILEGFAQSQPAGEINFHNERMRLEERMKLLKRQVELEAIIDKLEATEFDFEEIGEDDMDGVYAKLVRDLDFYKAEMKRLSIELAYIDGLKVEEEPHFELKVPPRSLLSRLSPDQLSNLEAQMFEIVKANKNKRTAMFVDKSIIDSMIEKLNIDPTLFKKEELRHISKDALDAYKEYFRNIDAQNREVYYNELCERQSLQPKEGIILKNPDDVPEDVKVKLELNNRRCKREIEEILEEYSKRPCAEDSAGDVLDENDDDEADETSKIIETVRRKGIKFERVKEEPRDDCEEELLLSGDEVDVDIRIANAVVSNNNFQFAQPSSQKFKNESDSENDSDAHVRMETNGCSDGVSSSANGEDESFGDHETDGHHEVDHEDDHDHARGKDDDDDDEIEVLGTIEPNDKIEKVELE